MYKLEERILFDAALPADLADVAEANDPQEVTDEITEEYGEETSFEQDVQNPEASSDLIENDDVSTLTEQLESLTTVREADQSNELYIIDTTVPDYQTLITNVPESAKIELLDPQTGSIESITELLSDYNNLDALHILSHGSTNQIQIGADIISSENISLYSSDFSAWGNALTDSADILLYGCNVASSAQGETLVASVSALTKADVAASVDTTGISGNWDLEFTTGSIEAITVYAQDYAHNLAEIVIDDAYVYNVGGSISDALETAVTSAADGDTISFSISDELRDSFSVPDGFDRDFDGDGDNDIYITLENPLTISEKSLTINFDTDGVEYDRDVILVGAGINVENKANDLIYSDRTEQTVSLSQFAIVNAGDYGVYTNGGTVNLTDVDIAGNVHAIVAQDSDANYLNIINVVNGNIYNNAGEQVGPVGEDAVIHATGDYSLINFTNVSIFNNTFDRSLINAAGAWTNVSIVDNSYTRITGAVNIEGTMLTDEDTNLTSESQDKTNITIINNSLASSLASGEDIAARKLMDDDLAFTNGFVAGNTISYWVDSDNNDVKQGDTIITELNQVFTGTKTAGISFIPTTIALNDWDGDGTLDYVVDTDGELVLYLVDSNGDYLFDNNGSPIVANQALGETGQPLLQVSRTLDDYLELEDEKRVYVIIDGIIHYKDSNVTAITFDSSTGTNSSTASSINIGADNFSDSTTTAVAAFSILATSVSTPLEYNTGYTGTIDTGQTLNTGLNDARSTGLDNLTAFSITATDGTENISYNDKVATPSPDPIDVSTFFTPLDSTNTVTYTADSLPAGVTLSGSTLTYTQATPPGTYTIVVTGTESGAGNAQKTIVLTVANAAPTATVSDVDAATFTQADVTGTSTFSLATGTAGAYFEDLIDTTDTIDSYNITSISLDTGTAKSSDFTVNGTNLEITNKFLEVGTYTILFTATDNNGAVSEARTLTLTVTADLAGISPVDGETITVTNATDEDDTSAAQTAYDGADASLSERDKLQLAWTTLNAGGSLSLREAIWFAGLAGEKSNDIVFKDGTTSVALGTVTIDSAVTISGPIDTDSDNDIDDNVVITGSSITISNNATVTLENVDLQTATDTAVTVESGSSATLSYVEITGGTSATSTIENAGNLTIDVVYLASNTGANLVNTTGSGSTSLTNVSIENNTASGSFLIDGNATITNTTIVNNTATALTDEASLSRTITDPTLLDIDPSSASITNNGTVNGVTVIQDSDASAGADRGINSETTNTSITITDSNGRDIERGSNGTGGDEGDTLTANNNVRDADGIASTTYEWFVGEIGSQTLIATATEQSYTIKDGDIPITNESTDQFFTVKTTITDDKGFITIIESTSTVFNFDTSAPSAPVVTFITPASNFDATPVISGTGEAGTLAVITVSEGTTPIYQNVQVRIDNAGNWSYELPLTDAGTYSIDITGEDDAGNQSSAVVSTAAGGGLTVTINPGSRDENPITDIQPVYAASEQSTPGTQVAPFTLGVAEQPVGDTSQAGGTVPTTTSPVLFSLEEAGTISFDGNNAIFDIVGGRSFYDLSADDYLSMDTNGDGFIDEEELRKFFSDEEEQDQPSEDNQSQIFKQKSNTYIIAEMQHVNTNFETDIQKAISKFITKQ